MSDQLFHPRSTDILQGCVRLLRNLVGADAVSLYIPPSSDCARNPILLHDGNDVPVAELADIDAAAETCSRYDCGDEAGSQRILQRISSSSTGGILIRVSPPHSILQSSPPRRSPAGATGRRPR